jgi:phage terminase large subunit GpA-like protein
MAFWTLDYFELPGDPAEGAVWAALTEELNRAIQRVDGVLLRVEAMAQDQAGHRTDEVKNFIRQALVRRPMSIHGAIPNNAPVLSKPKLMDVTHKGKTDKRGVRVYTVGTVACKDWLFGRLSVDAEREAHDRVTHFSEELDAFYFAGLVSETYDPAKNRYVKKKGARNEPLDTWCYSYAAAHHPELRLHRHKEADWAARDQYLLQQLVRQPDGSFQAQEPDSPEALPPAMPSPGKPKAKAANLFAPISMQ